MTSIPYEDIFKAATGDFAKDSEANVITKRADLLTNSNGEAITAINECISSFNDLCDSINTYYAATLTYLRKVSNDFKACERDNMMK